MLFSRTEASSKLAQPIAATAAGNVAEAAQVDTNSRTWPKSDHSLKQEQLFELNALGLAKKMREQSEKGDDKERQKEAFDIKALAAGQVEVSVSATQSQSQTQAKAQAEQGQGFAGTVVFHLAHDKDLDFDLHSPTPAANGNTAKTTNGAEAAATSTAVVAKKETKFEHKIVINADGSPAEDHPDWHTDPATGLSDEEAKVRLAKYGMNEIVEHKVPGWKKFLSYFRGSISYLIELAILLSGILQDWTDFGIITALLFVNALIGYLEESKAESAVEALRNTLAQHSKVIRNGKIVDIPSKELVPGDIVALRLGDVVPADARLLGITTNLEETKNDLSLDMSALTGESLPVTKRKGDEVWSSSIVKQGQMLAVVMKTGERTFVGRAAHLMNMTQESGHFQAVVQQIGNFLIYLTLVMVIIILILALAQHKNFLVQLQYALVLTIASIPVGLPTVLSVTMAIGAQQLAKKKVIVKRLTAVEEMAGLDTLCSDKTGTLTLNELTLDEPYLAPGRSNADLLFASYLASEAGANDAIELCVRNTAVKECPELKGVDAKSSKIPGYRVLHFQPFDPVSKLTRATVHALLPGEAENMEADENKTEVFNVAKGAPQVILKMTHMDHNEEVQQAIAKMASRGLRALGVARSNPMIGHDEEKVQWELVGLLSLLDPPRPDSGITIKECNEHGLSVKMITGDAILIAKEVAKRLGMHRNILTPARLNADKAIVDKYLKRDEFKSDEEYDKAVTQFKKTNTEYKKGLEVITHCIGKCDGFAQVVPEDKYRVVELLQLDGHMVGMTGDGVNDAPALKKANVGVAVHGATDAARSAASIVLLLPGLHAIVDGIMTSRCIFQRMRSYALYRITSTIHFIIFLFFTIVIWDFFIQAVLIVLIAILNDAATLVISLDYAIISAKPDKWRMGQMLTLSTILAAMLVGASFAHFLIGYYVIGTDLEVMKSVMYLQISSCPHFVIFSTRLVEPWYKQFPHPIFFLAVFATQVFAMFISVYGVFSAPCGWGWGLSVMAISLVYFMLMDIVKVWVYKKWSFEMTAKLVPTKSRTEKLRKREIRTAELQRFNATVRKLWKVANATRFAMRLRSYKRLPEPKFQMPKAHH